MKKILYIIGMAVATTLASCQKDADVVSTSALDRAVKFSSSSITPLTKVSGTNWAAGDAIGIFVFDSEQNLAYDNIKYTAASDGDKVSFNPTSEIILYPQDGSEIYCLAYYPFQEGWSFESDTMIFDLSGQDGTAEGQEMADLLISENAVCSDGDEAELIFTHAMSKVQITVSNYEELSAFENLDELTATLYTKRTHYDLVYGDAELADETKALGMVKSTDGDKAIFTAIFVSGEVSDEIIFTDGNYYYSGTLSLESAECGYLYSFTATVGDQGLTIVELVNDGVTDWSTQAESALGVDLEIVDGVYYIYSAAGMKLFADAVNSGSYSLCGQLMCDIDLEGSADNKWTTICSYDDATYYKGTFDGGGFEISGLYVYSYSDNPNSTGVALFSSTSGATIKNLSVSGSVAGKSYIAGVVGSSLNTTFANCHSSVTVMTSASENSSYFGGIAGGDDYSTFVNCYNSGTISGGSYAGGIVGGNYGSAMINCHNTGSVNGWSSVGGVVGSNFGSAISNCYNAGAVSSTESTTSIGGVAGYVKGSSTYLPAVSDCYFDSTIYEGDAVGEIMEGYEDYVTNLVDYSTTYMQSEDFVELLNDWVDTYNESSPDTEACSWVVAGDDSYPTFDND